MPTPNHDDPLRTTDHQPSSDAADESAKIATVRQQAEGEKTVTYQPAVPTTAPQEVRGPTGEGKGWPAVRGYELLEVLGSGGMGVVYKARHLALNRLVALKMIRASSHAGPELRARFKSEAEAVARLQHANIVQIYEVDEADGDPFCALEFVEGGSLAEELAGTPLAPSAAAELVRTLAAAMEAAHARGVVHRDLKPANVLLTGDGVPKITDFGLAKLMGEESGQTRTGAIMGTPSYMAPEQAEGHIHAIAPVTDVYALGAILYECLTGRPPFKGAGVMETLEQVRRQEPVPPAQLNAQVPRDLETICLKCLMKEPGRRYPAAAALAEDLRRFLAGEPIVARPVGRLGRGWRWCRRNPRLAVVGALAVFILVAGSVVSTFFGIQSYLNAGYFQREYSRAELNAGYFQKEYERAEGLVEEKDKALTAERIATGTAKEQTKRAVAQTAIAVTQTKRADERTTQSEWLVYIGKLREAQLEWEANNFPVALLRLNECRLGFRGWEHDYLWTLFHSNQRDLRGHADIVQGVAVSSDGKYLASAASRYDPETNVESGEVKVWNAADGKLVHTLPCGLLGLHCLAFTPDGRQLACLGSRVDPQTRAPVREVKVWDAAGGREVRTLPCPAGSGSCLAFSPDGKFLALACTGEDGGAAVKVVDATTGKEVHALRGTMSTVAELAFSADGTRLAAAGDSLDPNTGKQTGVVKVWEVAAEQESRSLEEKGHSLFCCVAFSPDGKQIVAGSWHQTIHVWDAGTGRPIRILKGHTSRVNSLAFGRDGQLVSGSSDSTVRVWDAAGQAVNALKGHTGDVTGVAFATDGRHVVSGGGEWRKFAELKWWDATAVQEPLALVGHQDEIPTVALRRDGKLVASGSADHTIKLWDAATGRNTLSFPGDMAADKFEIRQVAFSPDGTRLACAGRRVADDGQGNGRVNLLDAATGKVGVSIEESAGEISVAFSPDGTRLVTADNQKGVIHQWDAATGKAVPTPAPMSHWALQALAVSPDGKSIASGGGRQHQQTGDWHGEVIVWDAATGTSRLTLRGHEQLVTCVAFSPDGTLVASGSHDRTVRVWDARNGQLLHTLAGHTAEVTSVAFSPDGARLVSGSNDKTVRLWDVASGQPTFILRGHAAAVTSVAFSGDGSRLVSGSEDRTVRVWDAGHRQPLVDPDQSQSAAARYAALGAGHALKGDHARAAAAFAEGLDRAADAAGKATVIREAAAFDQAFATLLQLRPQEPQLVAAHAARLAEHDQPESAAEARAQARSLYEARLRERPDESLATAYAAFLCDGAAPRWTPWQPSDMKSAGGATLTLLEDGSVLAGGVNPPHDTYMLTLPPPPGAITAVRLQMLPHYSLPAGATGRGAGGQYNLTEIQLLPADADDKGQAPVRWRDAFASLEVEPQPLIDAPRSLVRPGRAVAVPTPCSRALDAADGEEHSSWRPGGQNGAPHHLVFEPQSPVPHGDAPLVVRLVCRGPVGRAAPSAGPFAADPEAAARADGQNLGCFRLAVTDDPRALEKEWLSALPVTGFTALGRAYLATGEPDRAAAVLERAVERDASGAALLLLALAQHRQGRGDAARQSYDRATAWLKRHEVDASTWLLARRVTAEVARLSAGEAAARFAPVVDESILTSLTAFVGREPKNPEGYRVLAEWHARRGRWREAADDWAEVLRLAPQHAAAPNPLGMLLAGRGDAAPYRQHCQALATRLGGTTKPAVAYPVALTCLLMPDAAPPPILANLVRTALKDGDKHPEYQRLLVLQALHAYRSRQWADALAACRASRERDPAGEDAYALAAAHAIEALARQGAGETDKARESLAAARAVLDRRLPKVESGDLGPFWYESLVLRILVREAEGLIEKPGR